MIRNFLITTYRNFTKHKFFTLINITGLSVGMASCLLILAFIVHELSYDNFHKNHKQIYRISARGVVGETKINQVYTTAKLPETLMIEFGEVINASRIFDLQDQDIRLEDQIYSESNLVAADSTFFEIFSFPLIQGSPKNVLNQPNTIVLSESTAKKIFGDEDPVNRIIKLFGETNYKITGVMKDMPQNSHIHFNAIISLVSFGRRLNENWWNNNFKTYIVLNERAIPEELEAKFPDFIKKHIGEGKAEWEEWLESGNKWEYFLQPLASIHLNSDLNGEFEANGNINYIYIFISAAVLIIIVASVNFMNLSTAKSEQRVKEVGLRKVIGSGKALLVSQFLSEAVLMSILAFLFSFVLILILLPWFNKFTGKEFLLLDIFNMQSISYILIGVFGLGIISGMYPAFYLSSFRPIQALKSSLGNRKGKVSLRGMLVVGQFVISIFLILGTMVVYRQLHFLQNVNLGFDKEQIIVLENAHALDGKYDTFKGQLLTHSDINDVSISWSIPGKSFMNWGCSPEGRDGWTTLNINLTDVDFLKTFGMSMTAGRYFSSDFPSDSSAIIINDNAQKLLEWEDPLERKIKMNNKEFHVVGIIKDYHYESLHTEVRPMGMLVLPESWTPNYVSIKTSGMNVQETLDLVESKWGAITGDFPFQYTFYDQEYDQLYKNEVQTSNMFIFFAAIAIFIACLGLFALSAFVAEKRTKEIGIRKVNGAGINTIIVLLSSGFTKWVVFAFIISVPLSYLIMHKWLQNFAYKVDLSWWIFGLAGLTALVIALITVSFQSIKAAIKNPVDALRYE